MEIKEMNIFEKMSNITNELETVLKGLTVKAGTQTYKAVSEKAVLSAVKPAEYKYRVYSYPISREIVESGIMKSKSGTKQLYLRVKTIYRFVNIDKPSDFIDTETIGDGVDTQDKAPGKGMTYGDKYALLKGYKIETGDDPDAKGSEGLGDIKKTYNNKGKSQYRELMEIIEGTPLTQANLVEWVTKKYGSNIRFNDLSLAQFNELKTAIQTKIEELMQ